VVDDMSHLRLFLCSLLMGLICIAALIGYAVLMQDWLAKPYNEESSSGISSKIYEENSLAATTAR